MRVRHVCCCDHIINDLVKEGRNEALTHVRLQRNGGGTQARRILLVLHHASSIRYLLCRLAGCLLLLLQLFHRPQDKIAFTPKGSEFHGQSWCQQQHSGEHVCQQSRQVTHRTLLNFPHSHAHTHTTACHAPRATAGSVDPPSTASKCRSTSDGDRRRLLLSQNRTKTPPPTTTTSVSATHRSIAHVGRRFYRKL